MWHCTTGTTISSAKEEADSILIVCMCDSVCACVFIYLFIYLLTKCYIHMQCTKRAGQQGTDNRH